MPDPKFTADDIRKKAAKLLAHFGPHAAYQYTVLLEYLAARLESPAEGPPLSWHMYALDDAREQGRREVYAEIVKACGDDPRRGDGGAYGGYECVFCGEGDENYHKPDCLWLRARAAVESAKANHEQP